MKREGEKSRRGTVAVFTAVSLVTIFGFVALAVDLGFLHHLYAEMQRSVDAAALAGASGLPDGNQEVQYRVESLAGMNAVNGEGVIPEELTITLGHWEDVTRTFTPVGGDAPVIANAVQVEGHRPSIPLFFAPLLGVNTSQVVKHAIAVYSSSPCNGIWGMNGIHARGSIVTDSYVSTEGAYGMSNIYQNGDLCSCQDLQLDGAVQIRGDAMHGEGYDTFISGNAYQVFGVRGEQPCDVIINEFSVDDAADNNNNANIPLTSRNRDPFGGQPYHLSLTATDNLTLPPGDYYFDSAEMDGQSRITITGPTRFFISGDAVFTGGGFVNTTGNPHNLLIYSTGASLTVIGTAGFVGGVIAPTTDVLLTGNSQYYGSIIGGTVELPGNASVHVDESLNAALLNFEARSPVLVK